MVKRTRLMAEPPLLTDLLPAFAAELEQALREGDEPLLADQIRGLHVVDRCRCSDDFCAMFYTMPPPRGTWAALGQHECVEVDAITNGIVVLDLVDRRIGSVEVLYRDEVRDRLFKAIP